MYGASDKQPKIAKCSEIVQSQSYISYSFPSFLLQGDSYKNLLKANSSEKNRIAKTISAVKYI